MPRTGTLLTDTVLVNMVETVPNVMIHFFIISVSLIVGVVMAMMMYHHDHNSVYACDTQTKQNLKDEPAVATPNKDKPTADPPNKAPVTHLFAAKVHK